MLNFGTVIVRYSAAQGKYLQIWYQASFIVQLKAISFVASTLLPPKGRPCCPNLQSSLAYQKQ